MPHLDHFDHLNSSTIKFISTDSYTSGNVTHKSCKYPLTRSLAFLSNRSTLQLVIKRNHHSVVVILEMETTIYYLARFLFPAGFYQLSRILIRSFPVREKFSSRLESFPCFIISVSITRKNQRGGVEVRG